MKDGHSCYINFSLEERIKELVNDGYSIRIHKFKSKGRVYFYVKAMKTVNGKRKEITVARISPEEAEKLEKLGLITKRKRGRKVYKEKSESPNNNTTTSAQPSDTSNIKNFADSSGGYGGCKPNINLSFGIHEVSLKFTKPWVSVLFVQSLGANYNEQNKQHVLVIEIGRKRYVKVQVNRSGTAQVFLTASENPLSIEEFIGFCKFYLPSLFYRLTGREVSLSDFIVMRSPEINVDIDGAYMDGAKVITIEGSGKPLDRYCDELIRIYQCDPMEKETMPNGGVRVEVRASGWKGLPLSNIVSGLSAFSRLPSLLSDVQRTLEEVKGSMSSNQIELGAILEAVYNRFANILWAMFEKHDSRLELVLKQILKELLDKVEEWVRSYVEHRLQELGYNVNRMGSNNGDNGSSRVMTLDDLPIEFARFLGDLDEAGYVRIMYDKIMYGDRTWQAIRYFRGNIDGFIEEASYEFVDGKRDLRDLFKAVMKAIRFYDNRFNGSVGVPWDRFVSALERFYGKKLEEIEKELRSGL